MHQFSISAVSPLSNLIIASSLVSNEKCILLLLAFIVRVPQILKSHNSTQAHTNKMAGSTAMSEKRANTDTHYN
jgi:hypothetical protein